MQEPAIMDTAEDQETLGVADNIEAVNPLARLDAAMESFVKITEDFMIRTSYKTDKHTSKEISALKNKRQSLVNVLSQHRQKCSELKRGYVFLMQQLDETIKELDATIAEETLHG